MWILLLEGVDDLNANIGGRCSKRLLFGVDDRNANIGGLYSKRLLFELWDTRDLFDILRQWWVHCVFFVLVLVLVKARDTSQLVIFFALVFVLIFEVGGILSFSTTIHAFDKCITVFIICLVHWLLWLWVSFIKACVAHTLLYESISMVGGFQTFLVAVLAVAFSFWHLIVCLKNYKIL